MGYYDDQFHVLIGRTVIFVEGATLYLDNGDAYEVQLEGDCCSMSEFTSEGIAAFQELLGAEIRKVEDRSDAVRETQMVSKWGVAQEDKWHFLVFTTDKGHVTVDWRNVSNGYYDGNPNLFEREPLPLPVHDLAVEKSYASARRFLDALRKKATP